MLLLALLAPETFETQRFLLWTLGRTPSLKNRETYTVSSTGYFDRNVDLVDMERARMKVTRVCFYHVDHNDQVICRDWRDLCTNAF